MSDIEKIRQHILTSYTKLYNEDNNISNINPINDTLKMINSIYEMKGLFNNIKDYGDEWVLKEKDVIKSTYQPTFFPSPFAQPSFFSSTQPSPFPQQSFFPSVIPQPQPQPSPSPFPPPSNNLPFGQGKQVNLMSPFSNDNNYESSAGKSFRDSNVQSLSSSNVNAISKYNVIDLTNKEESDEEEEEDSNQEDYDDYDWLQKPDEN